MLEYANIVWFPHTNKNITILERIQRKAVRFIFNKYRSTDSPTALLQCAKLASLETRSKFHCLKFLHQLIHRKLRIDSESFLTLNRARETQHKHMVTIEEYLCMNVFYYSFFPRATREWNALDDSLIAQLTFEKFCEHLGKYLFT